tara:strand:- start:302 stop:4249 length:3948 start_codon:yes stop_codon:yes gene_type:complete
MLKTEKLLNSYGLTFSEAEDLLQIDVLSSLAKAKSEGGDNLALQVATLDERVAQYLETSDIKKILEENKKEPIGATDVDLDLDLSDFELDLDDLEGAGGFDIRITDADLEDIEIDEAPLEEDEVSTPPPMAPAPLTGQGGSETGVANMVNAIVFENVPVSNFFSELVKTKVPKIDSQGALVISTPNRTIRGLYLDDFVRISTMPLNNADMKVEILSQDAEDIIEFQGTFGEGRVQMMPKGEMSLPKEEVSSVFSTQQYLVGGQDVNTSFDGILNLLERANNKDEPVGNALDFPVGKAVHHLMVRNSNFYIKPKTLYALANCDEFFSASVGGYRYITNYCEANDLKQLRIFEIGGSHLNIPFSDTKDDTITDSVLDDETSAFSGKVGSIIGDSYTKNERLYQVGFTQILPKEVQYDRVDNLSEKAGYFVFASPNSSRVFYIPAVVYNYFDKFYGTKEVRSSMIPNSDLFTLFFMDDDDVKGFIMIDKKNAPSGAPARLLPTNPDAYLQTIVGENTLAFSEKVDIESREALEFMGEIKTRPESEEPSLRDIFEEQIALFEQALEFMDEGEDDDEIAALRDAIEGARLMIDDDTEEQAEEEIIESMDAIPDEKDELGQVSVANDQEILPTPSADDLEVEEVIAEEKEDVLEADDEDLDLDLDDLEISQVRLSEEDIKDKLDEMGVDYNEIMEEEGDDLNEIQKQFLGYDYDANTNTWSMGFAKGGKVEQKSSTAIPITGSLEGVDVKKVFEEATAFADFEEYTKEEMDAIGEAEGFESDAYSAVTLPKNFPWQTAEIISSVEPFEFIEESMGVLEEKGYDPEKYALSLHANFGKNPKLLTDIIAQNDESFFEVVFVVEIGEEERKILERENKFRSSYYAKGGKTMDDKVSDKIRLLRKEGKPQDQAVAIALSMRDKGKLAHGGKVKGSDKYGSWYYMDDDGTLFYQPQMEGQSRAPKWSRDDEEWIEVSERAFNSKERKQFEDDIQRLFGQKPNFRHGGTTHVSYEIVKSEDIGLDAKEFKYHVLSSQGNTLGCQTMKECREVISLAKQGRIELAKGGLLDNEFKFDKNFVIYVPSTSNVGDVISMQEMQGRVGEVEELVANEFGGFTKTETDGGYKASSGDIIEEDIVKVSVFSTNEAWEENEKRLIRAIKIWAKEWGQEAIGFEYEGDLYYIDAKGKMAKGGKIGKMADIDEDWHESVRIFVRENLDEKYHDRSLDEIPMSAFNTEEKMRRRNRFMEEFDEEQYLKYEHGGKVMTPSEIVALLTDREVAQKLAEKMMQSLESLEYGEMTEQDMATEAMQDIMHSRKMLTEILTYEA